MAFEESLDQSLALPLLVGDICEEISFVADYVVVVMRDHRITCATGPEIVVNAAMYLFPGPGSRDALRGLINESLQTAVQLSTGAVEFGFSNGQLLRVSPWEDFPTREFIYIAKRDG